MQFYELCRCIRNQYLNENNREIELQILNQIHAAFFANGDKLPNDVTLELNIKSILKNHDKIKYWHKSNVGVEISNARIRSLYFFETVVVAEMLTLVLDDLFISDWDIKHFRQHSAWKFSIQISFSKNIMRIRLEDGDFSEDEAAYLRSII